MDRRGFLATSGALAGVVALPGLSRPAGGWRAPDIDRRRLADAALETARAGGASYADIRIGRYRSESIGGRERTIQTVTTSDSVGAGVRVLLRGTWGFAATNRLTLDGIAAATREALAIARANAAFQSEPVVLAPEPGHGEVSWRTPLRRDAFAVPVKEKADLLLAAGAAALDAGATFVSYSLFLVNEQKYVATSDGTYADQDIHRIWPTFTVTVTDRATGRFETRNALSAPSGMGWEYLEPTAADRLEAPGGTVLWHRAYDMVADARLAARQAAEKHRAASVTPGKYTLVLEPSHLFLTIHESVGHPLELDRVLGYEANYAGTSFATLDKWRTKAFRYGSELVHFVADRTEPGSLGAAGYDDEGVKTRRWDLVKDGILVDYQAIRDQAHVLGHRASHGCCFAQTWADVPFQRMPNVSLQPGARPLTPDQLIADVERGIYIQGRGSYSIDQQRYNFQFGGQVYYEIRNGRITGMLNDVAYQANTQEFWNACSAICDRRDWRLNGSFFDGKGEPSQVSAVSHGSATARFDGISVINTGRKL